MHFRTFPVALADLFENRLFLTDFFLLTGETLLESESPAKYAVS